MAEETAEKMVNYTQSPECLEYIQRMSSKIWQEGQGWLKKTCVVLLFEKTIDSFVKGCAVLINKFDRGKYDCSEPGKGDWRSFERKIIAFTALIIPSCLRVRGIKVSFQGVIPYGGAEYYFSPFYLAPFLASIEEFINYDWLKDQDVNTALKSRLEIAAGVGKRLLATVQRGKASEEQTWQLFEGMLLQAFILLLQVPFEGEAGEGGFKGQ